MNFYKLMKKIGSSLIKLANKICIFLIAGHPLSSYYMIGCPGQAPRARHLVWLSFSSAYLGKTAEKARNGCGFHWVRNSYIDRYSFLNT